jgi:hypothetical protein
VVSQRPNTSCSKAARRKCLVSQIHAIAPRMSKSAYCIPPISCFRTPKA